MAQTGKGFSSLTLFKTKSNIYEQDVPLPHKTPRRVEVVISRYNEQGLDVLLSLIPHDFHITIYNKGNKLVVPTVGGTIK